MRDRGLAAWTQALAVGGLLVLTSTLSILQADDTRMLRAGAATSNITPPLGELIVGGFKPFPATSVHDELHARCLVLDDGETTLAFIIADNVGIPREVFDAAREIIVSETKLPAESLLFAATHTHSATTARGENKAAKMTEFTPYQQFLVRRMADVVRIALAHLEPARIGWGRVDVPEEVFNRRWHLSGNDEALRNPFGGVDQVRMNPPRGSASLLRPAGPVDPEVSFISVQSAEGRPMALLANYSLHYVGGVRGSEISADYFAVFANRMAELLNTRGQSPPFVGIMTNGTSGNINNINFKEPGKRYEPYEKMQEVAHLVAQRVYEAQSSLTYQTSLPLAARTSELTLAVRQPDDELLGWAERVLAQPDDKFTWHRYEQNYARRVQSIAAGPAEVTILLQAFRIGDLSISAIPFETFVETGLELKERSPFERNFTIELANGSYGYLPTPEHHSLGGYETWLGTNYVQKDASDRIVERLLEMFDELKQSAPAPAPATATEKSSAQ